MSGEIDLEYTKEWLAGVVSLIQLTHQMTIKSSIRALTGYESMCYEKLCDFCKEYAEQGEEALKRGNNEGSRKAKGGDT